MQKWLGEIFALLISLSSINQLHGDQQTDRGKEFVRQVETSYQNGEYDVFLSQLHQEYQNAGKAGAIRGVFESAKSAIKDSPEEIKEKIEDNRKELAELRKERDKQLLEAITTNPQLPIADKVDSVVFRNTSSEQIQVLKELDNLKYHIPETAIGTIDNKISALETEYHIKSLLLDVASQTANTPSSGLKNNRIALGLEKLDKMEQAAKEANDKIWIKKIQIAKQAFRSEIAFNTDFQVLQALAMGTVQPQNSVEEKVKEIMIDFQSKKQGAYDRNLAQVTQK